MKRLIALSVVILAAMSCANGDQKMNALRFLEGQFPGASIAVSCTNGYNDDWVPCTGTVRYGDEPVQVVTVQCAANWSCNDGCFVGQIVEKKSTVIIHNRSGK